MARRLVACAVVAACVLVSVGVGSGAGAATTPKTALIYGDSLTNESRFQIANRIALRAGWTATVHAFPSTAPCDWLQWIDADLVTRAPSVFGIMTAGNTGQTTCMAGLAMGSPAYYDRYRADLETLFAKVTATGARVVYFNAPPFADPARNAAVIEINKIALNLAYKYHGVSISGSVRSALATSGKYAQSKPCLATETAAMGCDPATLKIAIRTLPGYPDFGVHLCPSGLPAGSNSVCATYSSGEFRTARAMVNQVVSPPAPKLP